MLKLMDLLTEGVHDKGIFKAVFVAGGPGSGKSYVAKELFGIPDKFNISMSGMKMINQDKEFKFLLKKYWKNKPLPPPTGTTRGFPKIGGGT